MIEAFERHNLDWRSRVCESAVRQGDLNLLKFAHERGALWGNAEAVAIRTGQLECLKYMVANGLNIQREVVNYLDAIERVGNIETLDFLVQNAPHRISPNIYVHATITQQRAMIDLLSLFKIEKPDFLGLTAVGTGDFEFFKWCIEKHNFNTKQYIKDDDNEPSNDILTEAFSTFNYDSVKYIIEKKLGPLIHTTLHSYFKDKLFVCPNVQIWKYVHSLDPFDFSDAELLKSAVNRASPELLDWMIENGAKFDSPIISMGDYDLPTLALLSKRGTCANSS